MPVIGGRLCIRVESVHLLPIQTLGISQSLAGLNGLSTGQMMSSAAMKELLCPAALRAAPIYVLRIQRKMQALSVFAYRSYRVRYINYTGMLN